MRDGAARGKVVFLISTLSDCGRVIVSNRDARADDDELFETGPQRTLCREQRAQVAFPIGGIGTGSISLGGWGQLRDFEIFNRPAKGQLCPMTFFTLHARREGGKPVTRVLQGPIAGPLVGAHGYPYQDGAGLPHFEENTFTGTFPVARVDFRDGRVPVRVSLEAFNPFIPLEADDSSLPVAVFLVHLKNPSRKASAEVALLANTSNWAGYPDLGRNVTEYATESGLRGLRMTTEKHGPDAPERSSMALATSWRRVQVQTRWPRLPAFDQLQLFWDAACRGRLDERRDRVVSEEGTTDVAGVALSVRLKPGRSTTLPVLLAWHAPNVRKYWDTALGRSCGGDADRPVWKNHYAQRFADAWDVARYAVRNLKKLEERTRRFTDALYGSTLPRHVLDAAGSQLSALKTTTCLRLPDGSFYGWEGCHPDAGCCEGTCTHVWNYAQALPNLFPGLQASALENHFNCSMLDDGAMTFRMPLPLGTRGQGGFHAAADGQMGMVLNVYRHWRITGDDAWLRTWWPAARKALEYAWRYWDPDRDGVMEGLQHNTYDVEFFGPTTMMGTLYLAALRAAERMARHLGEDDAAETYRRVAEAGSANTDEELWNGDYYVQRIDPEAERKAPVQSSLLRRGRRDEVLADDEPPYQVGRGCLSDQIIGQWYAHMLGLGYVLDRRHVRKALRSVFRHNFKRRLARHANTHRVYGVGDESGLVLCTWPQGQREKNPFPYAHEVWPGIEYQVAAHLVYEGRVSDGLTLVKAVRDRHEGARRNPWNEVECGNHYARSMASWSLVIALSGFQYSAPDEWIGFAPKVHPEDFRGFFCTGGAWGVFRQKLEEHRGRAELRIEEGRLRVRRIVVSLGRDAAPAMLRATRGTRRLRCVPLRLDDGRLEVTFDRSATVRPGEPLVLRWTLAK